MGSAELGRYAILWPLPRHQEEGGCGELETSSPDIGPKTQKDNVMFLPVKKFRTPEALSASLLRTGPRGARLKKKAGLESKMRAGKLVTLTGSKTKRARLRK